MEEGNSRLFLLLIYFALAVYLLPMFSHENSADEISNWATAVSLVENNSFAISPERDLIGENAEFVRIGEKIYSKNLPGISILAAPFYAMTRIFIGEPTAQNTRASWFVMRFFVCTLPLFFLATWLYQRDIDTFSLAALLFATPLFLSSLLLFSNILTAVLIYLAFRLLYDARNAPLRNNFLAGIISGFVIISESSGAIVVLIFGVGLFFTEIQDRFRRLFFFVSGLLPFIILLLIYSYAVFDSPFRFFGGAANANQALEMFSYPTFSNLCLLLFSPSQGLFFYAPLLVFSIIAFFTSREKGTLRKRVKIAAILFSILTAVCLTTINSGWTFGAQHLTFILPLLLDSFFDGETEDFPSLWRGFLFVISLIFCAIPALTFPFASSDFSFPHNTLWRPLLFIDQIYAPTSASFFGVSSNFWTISPAILLLSLVIYLVWRNSKNPLKFLIGILCAFLAAGIYLFVPNLNNQAVQQKREAIVNVIR